MKRNHPYAFSFIPAAPNPEYVGCLKLPIPTASTASPEPIYPVYHPKMAPVHNPTWNNNAGFINTLSKMFTVSDYNPSRGYTIDSTGLIYDPATSEDAVTGVISAVAIGIDTDKSEDRFTSSGTHIINTEDFGLRYACPTKDGKMLDLGPVEHACIVGNNERPEGVYVPMCNTKAMADGITILKEFYGIATENDRDLPPFEDSKELPAPDYHHECKCGGNCKCKK